MSTTASLAFPSKDKKLANNNYPHWLIIIIPDILLYTLMKEKDYQSAYCDNPCHVLVSVLIILLYYYFLLF